MFNSKNEILEKKIKDLENKIFKNKEERSDDEKDSLYGFFLSPNWWLSKPVTLEKRIDTLVEENRDLRNRFNALLNHFKIEYVKITEKNGREVTKEVFRKVKPKKAKKYDYED